MIDILQAPDHVFAVRFVGTLTGPDFEQLEREIEARLARHGRIGIVADLTGLKGVTPDALAKDLRYNLSKLGHWRQFPREAIITEHGWIATVAKVLDPLVPQVEVRPFHPGELTQAIAWASDFAQAAA
jgi:SpoIIAA-like